MNKLKKSLQKLGILSRPQHVASPVLRSVAFSMVRNEQDIIEPFLRHNAGLVDLMIVLDNLSTDSTRDIALETARDLGNIIVTGWPDTGYNQSQTLTGLLHAVQPIVFADYVFFLDADEFLGVDSADALFQSLKAVPRGGVGVMPWQTWVPDPSPEHSSIDPLDRVSRRRKVEAPQYSKAVLNAAGTTCDDLHVSQGAHYLLTRRGKLIESVKLDDLPLIHIPVRSMAQVHAKGVIGALANANRTGKFRRSQALQWRVLAEKAEQSTVITDDDLAHLALAYAQDSDDVSIETHSMPDQLPFRIERRHSDGTVLPAKELIEQVKSGATAQGFQLPPPPTGRTASAKIENAFEGDWHWNNIFLDQPPLEFAVAFLQPKSIIDIGCGSGVYPKLYEHLGVHDVLGVDGIEPEATVLEPHQYMKVDLQEPFNAGRTFDLVICLEVLEHIEPDTTGTALDTIARHANETILFSMAEPGQPGNGHINCRDMNYVLDAWEDRGWYPDLSLTLGLRALSSMSWFRRNIVLLRKGAGGDKTARDCLSAIGARPYAWWSQPPGLRETAFVEAASDLSNGYGSHK